jgi:hypothetical protein
MGREAGVGSSSQGEGGVSGVLQMDPKQISAGLTCLSAELSPTAKAARASSARADSGYLLVLGKQSGPCPCPGWLAGLGPVGRRSPLAGHFKGKQRV